MAKTPKKPKAQQGKADHAPVIPDNIMKQITALYEMANAGGLGDLEPVSALDLLEEVLDKPFDDDDALDETIAELEEALTELRIAVNSGEREARREAEELRTWLADRLEDDVELDGNKLIALGQAFGHSQFDPGPAFGELIARRLEEEGPGSLDEAGMQELLESMVEDAGEDPYLLFEAAFRLTQFMPVEHRRAMAEGFVASENPIVREAALGFLLDPDSGEAAKVLSGLVASAAKAAPTDRLVGKLVRLRGLLPPDRHASVDAAIEALRPGAIAAQPARAMKMGALSASPADGTGAQGLMADMVEGRVHHLLSVMIRVGEGITDCIVMDDMTKADIDSLVSGEEEGVAFHPISLELYERRLRAGLADNHAGGQPVPFNLLAIMEMLKLAELRPEPLAAEALLDDLLADVLFDANSPETLKTAVDALDDLGISESWLEAGDDVDALLGKSKSRKQRVEVLLRDYLPERRQFWIEQCAWTAAVLKDKSPAKKRDWVWAALLGKQLCGNGPVADSPLMRAIAEASVEVYMMQS